MDILPSLWIWIKNKILTFILWIGIILLRNLFYLRRVETYAECSILFRFKEGENFDHRNILDI